MVLPHMGEWAAITASIRLREVRGASSLNTWSVPAIGAALGGGGGGGGNVFFFVCFVDISISKMAHTTVGTAPASERPRQSSSRKPMWSALLMVLVRLPALRSSGGVTSGTGVANGMGAAPAIGQSRNRSGEADGIGTAPRILAARVLSLPKNQLDAEMGELRHDPKDLERRIKLQRGNTFNRRWFDEFNDAVDAVIEKAAETKSPKQREALYRAAEAATDAVIIADVPPDCANSKGRSPS